MLKLKLQYFGHLMQRVNSLEKTQMLGKIEGRSRKGQQRIKWLDGIINSVDISLSKTPGDSEGQEGLTCCRPWDRKDLDTTEQLNNSLTSNCQVVMYTWVRGGQTRIQSPLYSATDLIFQLKSFSLQKQLASPKPLFLVCEMLSRTLLHGLENCYYPLKPS